MNEKIYVIHYDGRQYRERGRKTAYLTKGAAKRVVTVDSEEMARREYEGDWYRLPREERERLTKVVAETRFEIVEYVSKEASK
jgi:hypothetical protein